MTLEPFAFPRHQPVRLRLRLRLPGPFRWVALLLGIALAQGGCSPERPFRIGTNQWVGYEGFYLARSLGHYDRTRIKLVELPSSTEVQQALRDGLLEAGALTLDETLTLLADGVDLLVVLVIDTSHGGDALLADPSLDRLEDLAGRRIGVETSAVGALLMDGALTAAGLSPTDVTLVPMTADRHVQALVKGHVEAVVTFEPRRTQLVKAGYRVLFDSKEFPGQIVDVLAVRTSALAGNQPVLQELLSGYFRALEYLADHPEDAHRRMANRLEVAPEDVPIMLAGIHFPGKAENHQLLSGTTAPLRHSAGQLARVMERAELLGAVSSTALTTSAEFLPPP